MREVLLCPACTSGDHCVAAALDQRTAVKFAEFSRLKYGGLLDSWVDEVPPVVLSCVRCGHAWYRHQPDPAQLNSMYAAGRPLRGSGQPSTEPSEAMLVEMHRLRQLIAVPGRRPRLLDYGSGSGRWSRAALQAGFDVVAFEPSAERSAGMNLPFELVHDVKQLAGRQFDTIQLEQVLEHVPDPCANLAALRGHCADKAVVRVTVPNLLRAAARGDAFHDWPFDGESPHVMAPFEHLHGFTPRSLRVLAERAGFESIALPRLLRQYPALVVRRWLSGVLPSWGATALMLQTRGRTH